MRKTWPAQRAASAIVLVVMLAGCVSGASSSSADRTVNAEAGGMVVVKALQSSVSFATADQARRELARSDLFTQTLTQTDRALRRGDTSPMTDSEYRAYLAEQAREWSADEVKVWSETIERLSRAVEGARVRMPSPLVWVRTSGRDEMGAHYTRGQALFFPKGPSANPTARLALAAHELFHVLSRHDPVFRRKAYELVGAKVLPRVVAVPQELQKRRVTNPDAPMRDTVVPVTEKASGSSLLVAPMLELDRDVEEVLGDPRWFRRVRVRLVVAEPTGRAGAVLAPEATNYEASMRRNTRYIIHPEEVLAVNFSHLILRRAGSARKLEDPELIDALERLLFRKTP